jgi:hypothetical protein
MRRGSKKQGVYAYLTATGVLEKGTEVEINAVRKKYWSEYKRKWRKSRRKEQEEITTSYTKEEMNILIKAAKEYGMNRTQFIKETTFAYINKSYLIPHKKEVAYIRQLLGMMYNSVNDYRDSDNIRSGSINILLEKINALEKEILVSIHSIKPLEQSIENVVRNNPSLKDQLINFLNSISTDDYKEPK